MDKRRDKSASGVPERLILLMNCGAQLTCVYKTLFTKVVRQRQ
jgi:hypothetical protein